MLCLSHRHENENSSNLELILHMNIFQFAKFGNHAFFFFPTLITCLFFQLNKKLKKMLGSHPYSGEVGTG